jgi:hypothetical protein
MAMTLGSAAPKLTPAVAVDANGDDHGGGHDPAGLAYLHVGRIQPEIGPLACRPLAKRHVSPGGAAQANPSIGHRGTP